MYWPEASALGQFWAKAFIWELGATCMAERFDPSSVKTIVFPTRVLKGHRIFHLEKWIAFVYLEKSSAGSYL